MRLSLPDPSLILLIGPSGCGKSTFAARHFRPTEVVSSDSCRALVSDDETDQSATTDAFAVLHHIADLRLARGRLTVIDATNVQERARRPLIDMARWRRVRTVAIVFDLPEDICQERNLLRGGRALDARILSNHWLDLKLSLPRLHLEGIRQVHVLRTVQEVASVFIERRPPSTGSQVES